MKEWIKQYKAFILITVAILIVTVIYFLITKPQGNFRYQLTEDISETIEKGTVDEKIEALQVEEFTGARWHILFSSAQPELIYSELNDEGIEVLYYQVLTVDAETYDYLHSQVAIELLHPHLEVNRPFTEELYQEKMVEAIKTIDKKLKPLSTLR